MDHFRELQYLFMGPDIIDTHYRKVCPGLVADSFRH